MLDCWRCAEWLRLRSLQATVWLAHRLGVEIVVGAVEEGRDEGDGCVMLVRQIRTV